jgi:hypothetical protein
MDKRKKMDCSATGEVILEAGNPQQPYWGHWSGLRIKKGSGLSRPFIEEQPGGDPLSCRQRLQTASHQRTQKTASAWSSLGQEVTPGPSIVFQSIDRTCFPALNSKQNCLDRFYGLPCGWSSDPRRLPGEVQGWGF